MQVSIDSASIEDYLGIGTLIINELGYTELNLDGLKTTLGQMISDKNHTTYVARYKSKTVGFMGLCKNLTFEMGGEVVRVIALAVDRNYQHMGIGTQLLAQAERYAAEHNIHYISLTSGLHRAGAHLFYERNGFEKKGFNFKKMIYVNKNKSVFLK